MAAGDLTGRTDDEAVATAIRAVTGFSADLLRRLAGTDPVGNLVCSPYSVLVALAMVRAGARGRTADELDAVLHAPADGRLHDDLSALTARIGSLAGPVRMPSGATEELLLGVASALWGQRGLRWEPEFLAVLAERYAAALAEADFVTAAEPAREAINDWVAGRTDGRIPDLVPPGLLGPATRLVLVNAIHVKAAWMSPFTAHATRDGEFRTTAGRRVTVPMMTGSAGRYASGDGWQSVDLLLGDGRLALAVVLPDEGRFAEVEQGLDGDGWHRLLTGFAPRRVVLTLPRWTFRTATELTPALSALGMPTAFTDAADLSGMTTGGPLAVSAVAHQAFVAVDEHGLEAAAATAAMVSPTGVVESLPVVVDRPFLFAVHEVAGGTPLFLGRVADPSQG